MKNEKTIYKTNTTGENIMRKAFIFALLLSFPLILAQCNHSQDGERHHMTGEQQMGQMMDNPEQRQAMMAQMAENPEMRSEFMGHMHSSIMMRENHEMMLDRMETIMNNPEQREQMKTHLQQMTAMMESEEFDREQMREMMGQSPMMGMHMNCIQMMNDM